jgi:hypothetical protein
MKEIGAAQRFWGCVKFLGFSFLLFDALNGWQSSGWKKRWMSNKWHDLDITCESNTLPAGYYWISDFLIPAG